MSLLYLCTFQNIFRDLLNFVSPQLSSMSISLLLPWVSADTSVEAYFQWICVFVVTKYQRQCWTVSAFRPFLTFEQKRQEPERDEELTIWRLIISGLTEIGHEAHPAVDTQMCEDTHVYTLSFPVGGFGRRSASEQQTQALSVLGKKKKKSPIAVAARIFKPRFSFLMIQAAI